MWYEALDRNDFIKSLYTSVPLLIDARIASIKVEEEGQRISMEFIMPIFADTPPAKWLLAHYNSIYIKLDFFDIDGLIMKLIRNKLNPLKGIEVTHILTY